MKLLNCLVLAASLGSIPTGAVPAAKHRRTKRLFGTTPTVTLQNPQATLTGSTNSFLGIIPGNIDSFEGVPFAQQPVGPLRLKPPLPLNAPLGKVDATNSVACPQFFFSDNSTLPGILGSAVDWIVKSPVFNNEGIGGQEDCLKLNVLRPSGLTRDSKLPVLFWIYGGGFELGSPGLFDPTDIVADAMAMGKPIVVVATNYRPGGFGFLPGKEILQDGSGNLGLLDQRIGLQWTADNVLEFGGDPDKVTIWGESAGSISVFDQLLLYDGDITYNGKPLFRGAIMNSGSAVPTERGDSPKAQAIYDLVVEAGGCSGQADTLGCLRGLSYDKFRDATLSVPGLLSYHSLALSYLPRPDGKTLTDSPEVLGKAGKYAKQIPYIVGDMEDEGTIFALFQDNLSTTADVEQYLSSLVFNEATPQQVAGLVDTYPDDPAAGSPFRTGTEYNWYPQFKRLAALLGDAAFNLARRGTLNITQSVDPGNPVWSYLMTHLHGTVPYLGTAHGTDLLELFFRVPDSTVRMMQLNYYMNFVYNLDPNNGAGGTTAHEKLTLPTWPQWAQGNMLMDFGADNVSLIPDNFRQESFEYFLANAEVLHF